MLGGLDEQFPVGVDEQDPVVLPLDEQDPDRSSRLGLDEKDPVVLPLDEQDPDRSSRLGLDEQDPVEGWMNRTTVGVKTGGSRVGGPELCV